MQSLCIPNPFLAADLLTLIVPKITYLLDLCNSIYLVLNLNSIYLVLNLLA